MSALLNARSENGGIVVSIASWASSIDFVGASVPVSFVPGMRGSTFVIQPDKPGVVAVSVYGSLRGDPKAFNFHDLFIPVLKKNGTENEYVVDLEHQYVPGDGRLGQVVGNHDCLMVRIGDEMFSNEPDKQRHERCRYVEDPNLLCRYLAGDASADDVRAAAVEHEEEVSARERLQLILKSCKAICSDVDELPETIAELIKAHASLQADVELIRSVEQESAGRYDRLAGLEREAYKPIYDTLFEYGLVPPIASPGQMTAVWLQTLFQALAKIDTLVMSGKRWGLRAALSDVIIRLHTNSVPFESLVEKAMASEPKTSGKLIVD